MELTMLNHPLPYFFPYLAAIALMEGIYLFRRNGGYAWRESLASVGVALGQQLIGLVLRGVIVSGLLWFGNGGR